MALRKIRIVQRSPHGSPRGLEVYDGETGEKLLNVYRIELDLSRERTLLRLTLGVEWEYEGVAEIVGEAPIRASELGVQPETPDEP